MSKRPAPVSIRANSPVSTSSSEPSLKRQKTSSPAPSGPIKVHILEAKLDSQRLSELFTLVESHANRQGKKRVLDGESQENLNLEICWDVHDADVVVTAIQMRKRLERHVEWRLAVRIFFKFICECSLFSNTPVQKEKSIVTPQWLLDSVEHNRPMPCGDYAALSDLHNETIQNCPDTNHSDSGSLPPTSSPPSPKPATADIGTSVSGKLSHKSRFACARASPLVCPNQDLVEQFDVVRRSRALEGEDISALTYARAIAVRVAIICIIQEKYRLTSTLR
jgi:hypothetical protein